MQKRGKIDRNAKFGEIYIGIQEELGND